MRSLLPGAALLLALPATAQSASPTDTAALKRSYSLFRPVPAALMRALAADRPGASQSAHTVDAGHYQLEVDLVRSQREDDRSKSYRHLRVADFTLRAGLTRRLEVQVNIRPFVRERVITLFPAPHSAAEVSIQGFGDAILRLKQNLFGNDDGRHALALSGYVRLPTGGNVGAGQAEFGVALPYEFGITEALELGVQVEAESRWDRASLRRQAYFNQSLLLDYHFGPARRLELFVEEASFWNSTQGTYQATLNAGPAVYATPSLRFDAGVHVPITHRVLSREFFAGVTWRI